MKRLFIFLLLFSTIFLCNCGFLKTEVREIEDEITLTIKDEFIPYLGYNEKDIPNYVFTFPGKLNIALHTTGPNEIVLTHNDDFIVSEIIGNLLKYYEENGIISYRSMSITKKSETHMNKKNISDDGKIKNEKVYLKVKDSNLYNEIAYITLENGLQLTMNFCRFEGEINGEFKTYYTWQYTESIRISLYYPLMIVNNASGERMILIVALPNAVINKIEPRYDVEGLMSKDDYLDSSYYTYPYPDYDSEQSGKDYDNSQSVKSITDYYTTHFQGHMENDDFVYTYLGYKFKVDFNKTTFTLTYIPE